MQNSMFDEKAKMTDLLTSEKHLTSAYNTFLCESETTEVMNCLNGLLGDTHSIKNEKNEELTTKGWNKNENAKDKKNSQAKQQFAANVKN